MDPLVASIDEFFRNTVFLLIKVMFQFQDIWAQVLEIVDQIKDLFTITPPA